MQEAELREIEWASPKEAPPVLLPVENPAEEYGPWQWAAAFGRATGRFGADAFPLQEDGKLRCPTGASLWLREVRQENAFTQRAVYLASQTDCQCCSRAASSAWHQERKEIVPVVSVLSVVFCLHLRWLSTSLFCSDRYDGWISQGERFAVPG